jgi:hypothetical protein
VNAPTATLTAQQDEFLTLVNKLGDASCGNQHLSTTTAKQLAAMGLINLELFPGSPGEWLATSLVPVARPAHKRDPFACLPDPDNFAGM